MANGDIYKKIGGTWVLVGNIATGGGGGSAWSSGSGAPSGGVAGDFYLLTDGSAGAAAPSTAYDKNSFRLTLASGHPMYRPRPQTPVSTNTSTEQITFTIPHGWTDGTIATCMNTSGGLTQEQQYWLHVWSSTNVSFHTSAAGGIDGVSNTVNLTANVTGEIRPSGVTNSTLYFSPIPGCGKKIMLYDGSEWVEISSAEVSLALGTLTADKNYDVFAYSNAGVLTLELLAWTSDIARATALVDQDGVFVKSGDTTRRYVGTIRTNSTTTTIDDTGGIITNVGGKRFVWNIDNQKPAKMAVHDFTTFWTYAVTNNVYRPAHNLTANRVEYVVGLGEHSQIRATTHNQSACASSAVTSSCGIGIDSTSYQSAETMGMSLNATQILQQIATYEAYSTIGYHYVQWLEFGDGANSQSINHYGRYNVTATRSGLIAYLDC